MSIKALQRRAREARHWLGQRALPLWAEVGFVRDGGVMAALELNHRPGDEGMEGDRETQEAMASLFALGPAVGFDPERGEALRQRLLQAAEVITDTEVEERDVPAKSLEAACAELRRRLMGLASAEGEDAILTSRAACRAFDALMDEFLTPEGGWIEGYDENGLPVTDEIAARLAGPIAAALVPLLPLAEA